MIISSRVVVEDRRKIIIIIIIMAMAKETGKKKEGTPYKIKHILTHFVSCLLSRGKVPFDSFDIPISTYLTT